MAYEARLQACEKLEPKKVFFIKAGRLVKRENLNVTLRTRL